MMKFINVRGEPNYFDESKVSHFKAVWVPQRDLVLDFSAIARLQKLKSLKIGLLSTQEGERLAKTVLKLGLERLEVSCHSMDYDGSRQLRKRWVDSQSKVSPLITFLSALCAENTTCGDVQSSSLRKTLKLFILKDTYHNSIPRLHQLLARAVAECEQLVCLSIHLRYSLDGWVPLTQLGLELRRSSSAKLAVHSWSRLGSGEEFEVYGLDPDDIMRSRWQELTRQIDGTESLSDNR